MQDTPLAKELYKRGASTVYIVDLPASNGAKVGLDDYLKSEGLDAYLGLDVSEQPLPIFLHSWSRFRSYSARRKSRSSGA